MAKDRIQRLAVFYEAQDSTLKALGHDPRLRFFVGKDKSADDECSMRCPSLPIHPSVLDVQNMRGMQDRLSVMQRLGWAGFPAIARQHDLPIAWHAELEQIRAEALACDYLLGVKADLQAYYQQSQKSGLDGLFDDQDQKKYFALLRYAIAGLGKSPSNDILNAESTNMAERFLPALKAAVENPVDYHQQAAALAQALGMFSAEVEKVSTEVILQEIEPEGEETTSLHLVESDEDKESSVVPQHIEWDDTLADQGYRIFTRKFDEQRHASELATEEEQISLREQLDNAIREARPVMSRLAGRLMNALFASTRTQWEQDQEEGLLDTARLDRLVADPLYATPYRLPRRDEYRDTVVSLLIDNSGSMRGHPITVAAMCADMLARTLERCGVRVEVLGYSTAGWRGGQVREDWVNAGKPRQPGRLNALRHIIYKSADQPWRRARNALAVMLNEALLKENIDGEALQWAWSRLMNRQESRRILIVISDGTPSDEATKDANGTDFLQSHLRDVVQTIECESEVELMAIGIGYDITDIYHNAVMIPAEGQLGDTLITQLCKLFAYGLGNTKPYRQRRHASIWSGAARRSLML